MVLFGSYISLEVFMYAAIGFLAAWLMALMCFPAVHHRAQRLLQKQYDQAPLSIQEIRAEKDQLRAGFAVATRDLELGLERLKTKTAAHATDIAKKSQMIERLKKELAALNDSLSQSGERENKARDEVTAIRTEFDAVHDELAAAVERERALRHELREARRELVLKDTALDAAQHEVTAIRSEIARIAPLLQTQVPSSPQRSAEVVPLAPLAAAPAARQAASTPDDVLVRAWTEIDAAARRVEQRYDGAPAKKPLSNQNLRATYAPVMKPAT